jgi:hypothetical protein
MSNHEDLEAWKQSIELVDQVYELCKVLPVDERFGLVLQMQRCAVSHSSQLGGRMQQGLNEGLSEICFHCPRITC